MSEKKYQIKGRRSEGAQKGEKGMGWKDERKGNGMVGK